MHGGNKKSMQAPSATVKKKSMQSKAQTRPLLPSCLCSSAKMIDANGVNTYRVANEAPNRE
jgi:hypothetical protein